MGTRKQSQLPYQQPKDLMNLSVQSVVAPRRADQEDSFNEYKNMVQHVNHASEKALQDKSHFISSSQNDPPDDNIYVLNGKNYDFESTSLDDNVRTLAKFENFKN